MRRAAAASSATGAARRWLASQPDRPFEVGPGSTSTTVPVARTAFTRAAGAGRPERARTRTVVVSGSDR